MTAQDIVTRIQQTLASLNIRWRDPSRDVFKTGAPTEEVKGIATTGMATFDLLKRASAAGRNFVITHEPTFWNDQDRTTGFESDPVYQDKQKFVRDQKMVVWRFHDHAHLLRPDPLVAGSARMLGLTQYASPRARRLRIPAATLRAFAADLGAARRQSHAGRGNPTTRSVGFAWVRLRSAGLNATFDPLSAARTLNPVNLSKSSTRGDSHTRPGLSWP